MNEIFDDEIKSVEVEVPMGHIEFRIRQDAKNTALVLEPMTAGDEEAEKAIRAAKIELKNGRLRVEVRLPGNVMSLSSGRGSSQITINGQTFVGAGNGVTIVNGRIVGGGGTMIRTDGVRATVYLPRDVAIHAHSTSAPIQVIGKAASVSARSTSGDVVVDEAQEASLSSTSGDIRTGDVDHATLRTTSGDVYATAIRRRGSLESVSGDVRAHTLTESFSATTVSGDVRVTHAPGVDLPRSALSTVSGRRSLSPA